MMLQKLWVYSYSTKNHKRLASNNIPVLHHIVDLFMGISQSRTGGARGGRAGYQLGVGPNVMEEKVTDTLEMPGETIQASEQVKEVLPKNGSMSPVKLFQVA